MIDDLCDLDMARVQRDAVAKDQQQNQWQHEGNGNAGRIADDLKYLFSHEAGQAHDLHDALLLACSCSSISAINASSMLGVGRSGRCTLALISTGVPCASISPNDINTRWSQYSASSIKCVVTRQVVPPSASAFTRAQNSRRAKGSTPEVGSSRKRMLGSCISAQARARRCLYPRGRLPAFIVA